MLRVKCPVCDAENELEDEVEEDNRFTCTNCFAQLKIISISGHYVARCALCIGDEIECRDDCERKIGKKRKKGFFDIDLE